MDSLRIITSPDSRDLRKVVRLHEEQSFTWGYLGKSIAEYQRATTCFAGERSNELDTTSLFHKAADTLRKPYLSFIYDLGREQDSLLFWLTSVSYRDRNVSPTFRQTCYLKVALELLSNWAGPELLVLVVADDPVRRSLIQNLGNGRARVQFISPGRSSFIRSGRDILKVLSHRAFFLVRESRRILQARRAIPRPYVPSKATTLIVCSVSRRNIGLGAKFHGSFFGELAEKIGAMGHEVAIVPLVLRDIRYQDALAELKSDEIPLMPPHRYLGFLDLVRAILSTLANVHIRQPLRLFAEMDISLLVKEDLRGHWASNVAADSLLLAAMVRKWASLNASIERIIYVFENRPQERALCWEFRRSLPQATVVGYQHARVSSQLLGMYLAPEGEESSPLPHHVVTVGEYSARLFKSGGHDPKRVRVGGALQISSLQSLRSQLGERTESGNVPTVLIASSEGLEETAELVGMAMGLFDETERVQVVVKCHPAMPFLRVAQFVGNDLPIHVTLSEKPITDLMLISSVMVYTGSTVCIQALALELPIVHLRPQFDFDMDPLEGAPSARLEATGLDELREKVRWVLANGEKYIAENKDMWVNLVDEMYGPVTEQTVHAFVD